MIDVSVTRYCIHDQHCGQIYCLSFVGKILVISNNSLSVTLLIQSRNERSMVIPSSEAVHILCVHCFSLTSKWSAVQVTAITSRPWLHIPPRQPPRSSPVHMYTDRQTRHTRAYHTPAQASVTHQRHDQYLCARPFLLHIGGLSDRQGHLRWDLKP